MGIMSMSLHHTRNILVPIVITLDLQFLQLLLSVRSRLSFRKRTDKMRPQSIFDDGYGFAHRVKFIQYIQHTVYFISALSGICGADIMQTYQTSGPYVTFRFVTEGDPPAGEFDILLTSFYNGMQNNVWFSIIICSIVYLLCPTVSIICNYQPQSRGNSAFACISYSYVMQVTGIHASEQIGGSKTSACLRLEESTTETTNMQQSLIILQLHTQTKCYQGLDYIDTKP